ncbi:extracellular solute-binding protein [Leptolyngbya sp. AN02str]|uniref:extracellular solute-binding protein n=1 Tax=Leptolyngbya sp. AN02str TaxID=3423363 RepID=UPI003D314218
MINRRSLLQGMGSLALLSGLAGCNQTGNSGLRLDLLEGSVPPQLLKDFQRTLPNGRSLSVRQVKTLATAFRELQRWHEAATQTAQESAQASAQSGQSPTAASTPRPGQTANLVSLGDAWLTRAIRQQLIEPLDVGQLAGWQRLPQSWQALMTRNAEGAVDPAGQIWAAPYRWTGLAIAYRTDKLQAVDWQPADWNDLWNPVLERRISILDNARVVLGLTLKTLGQSVNTTDLAALPQLSAKLAALQQQVRFYSSDAYLQPLMLGDTWVAVGWLADLLPVLRKDRRMAAVIPASGTVLSADVWVQPATASGAIATGQATTPTAHELAVQWINYCWQPENALRLSLLGAAASPVILGDRAALPASLQNNPLLLPSTDVLDRSEFLLSLEPASAEQYQQYWLQMRQPPSAL